MAVFGALFMYILSMMSLFKLRHSEPKLERTFKVPMYPWFPGFALVTSLICLIAMIYYNQLLAGVFFGVMFLGLIVFSFTKGTRQ